jgi:hypothetical protein
VKEELAPQELECFTRRGMPHVPACVERYTAAAKGPNTVHDPFPHPRYCLWLELWCPLLADRREVRERHVVVDIAVSRFYDLVVPWLAYGIAEGDSAEPAINLLDVIDELVEREDELFGSAVVWPVSELAAVFRDALHAVEQGDPRDNLVVWDRNAQLNVVDLYTRTLAHLTRHLDCCDTVQINVHWW